MGIMPGKENSENVPGLRNKKAPSKSIEKVRVYSKEVIHTE